MKLVSYIKDSRERLGIFHSDKIYNLTDSAKALGKDGLPDDMHSFLQQGESVMNAAKEINQIIVGNKGSDLKAESGVKLIAPVPHPTSCRDGYAFRQHVA